MAVHGIDDKPYAAVLGVAELRVFREDAEMVGPDGEPLHTIKAGDVLSIHGQTGEVFMGSCPVLSVNEDTCVV